MPKYVVSLSLLISISCQVGAFVPYTTLAPKTKKKISTVSIRLVSLSDSFLSEDDDNSDDDENFVLSMEEINPIIRLGGKDGKKEKIINSFGLWCLIVSLITGPIWILAMTITNILYNINDEWDPNRAIYDSLGKIWAKTWLTMTFSYPTSSGHVELLKQEDNGCLFVANHASYMDIPILATVLDPVFKFIAKAELLKTPCIGQQLSGGRHIAIDRSNRRSQIRTFKEGITWLKKGVPIMAFPEGKRSNDGRLMEFKGGIFAMAVKTNSPIVPITISNTHAIMPSNALFPVQMGGGKLHVHVHAPISTVDKTEAELNESVRKALLSKLPISQHPIIKEGEEVKEKVEEKVKSKKDIAVVA